MKILGYLAISVLAINATNSYSKDVNLKERENIIHVGKGKELAHKYHLDNLLKKYPDESWLFDNYIILSEGDLVINGDLLLDNNKWADNNIKMPDNYSEKIDIVGMVILGNLYVNGAVINSNGDEGHELLVKGDLYARNIIAGGSFISISGNTTIDEVIYAYYNHGTLYGYGNVKATVFINDDHAAGFWGEKNITHIYDDNRTEEIDEDDNEYYDECSIIPTLKSLLREDIVCPEEILEYLKDGHSVLKDSQYIEHLPKVFDQHFFDEKLERLMKNRHVPPSRILQRIPTAYRSEVLSKKAVEFNSYNIEFMPEKWLTELYVEQLIEQSQNYPILMEFIPEKFKTLTLCLEAAKRGSLLISDVPQYLLNDESLMMEIIHHNAWEYRNLPEKFIKKQYFMLLALQGGEYNGVLDVLAVLEEKYPEQNIFNQVITKALDSMGLELLEKLPGKAVTTEIFEYAQDKFQSLGRWDNLVKAHSVDFWKMFNEQMLDEISKDISHRARYDYALDIVWSHFWTDDFLINILRYTEPYAALDEIPYIYWSPLLVEAAEKYGRYGYYNAYIEDYREWEKRKSRPAFLNKIMGLFEH